MRLGPYGVAALAALGGASCASTPVDFARCQHRFAFESTPAEMTIVDAARTGTVGVRDDSTGAWITFLYRLRGDELLVDVHVPPSGAARLAVEPDDDGVYRVGFGGPPDVDVTIHPNAIGTIDMELFVTNDEDRDR
ncbi:hypothetical protein Pla163_01700 [Planctomycetes bacterium Pla163]|uniref:Lipoprotein n=1 Tax=Rohdeia mirabilis TaxID=2528008 RepID=A0A518CV46_9BACT|nr:hypothetical protein Pla163_01700 [Planctomycetes bacterium Pla163]